METDTDIILQLIDKLKEVSVRNTAEAVYDKIKLVKQKNNDKETVNVLEDLINNLITDKNELIQITKCYEQQFVTQDISNEDIEYITRELLPIVTTFLPFSGGDNEFVSAIKKVLSAETLKILKLLGFNYKEAIGQPLTSLVSKAIENQTNKLIVSKSSYKK